MRSDASAANAASFKTTLRISPEQVEVGGLLHDRTVGPNPWPDETPMGYLPDQTAQKEEETAKKKEEPSALSEGLHTLLDVVGMIPIVGEIADGANALVYLAEGNKTDAALSAAAMIPPGGQRGNGSQASQEGLKIAEKAQAVKKVTDKVNRAAMAAETAAKRVENGVTIIARAAFLNDVWPN